MDTTAAAFDYDFFISRRGSVAAMAQEVADILQAADYRVIVQDYDFAASGQFVREIDNALKKARNLLILYSHDYHSSFWTQQEFHNFLAAVAASNGERRIGVLRCDQTHPSGLLYGATFGTLAGVDDPAERQRIVLQVARGEAPAARPSPRIFGGTMPLENRLFTGRDDLLAAMHSALSAENATAALTQATVHGLGGVGKTSLARAYIVRFGTEYSGVWWITAADRAGTLAGLSSLAHAFDPRLAADMPPEQAAHAALDQIAARQSPFLLVYDNAPSPLTLSGLLPTRGARVLITSRHPDWAAQASELRVAEMEEEEAIALLQRRANRRDEEGARRLARELGYLPLALDQAGAFAKQTLISFDDYAGQVEALIDREGGNPDYPASVAATFSLAIDEAVRTAPAAEDVLGVVAWYAPDAIPLALLDDSIAPAGARMEALAALVNVSLATPAPDTAAGSVVTVHRLVQTVIRHLIAERGTAGVARDRAVTQLARKFPRDGYRNPSVWPLCRALLPHLRALLERVGPSFASASLAHLLGSAGGFVDGSGDSVGALIFKRRSLEMHEIVFGVEHPETLGAANNLAVSLETLGDFAGALALHERTLEARERVLGPEHPSTLVTLGRLASCKNRLGDKDGALLLYRRALEGQERTIGRDDPHTIVTVNNMAGCISPDDPVEALQLFKRALASRERVQGPEAHETLVNVVNVANCLMRLGDHTEALPLLRRAADGCSKILGDQHPQTLFTRSSLALCLYMLGDPDEAQAIARNVAETGEQSLGPENPVTEWVKQILEFILQGAAAGNSTARQ